MRFSRFLFEIAQFDLSYFYDGSIREIGGTSIAGDASPGIKWLFEKGYFKLGDTILDFGAGKYARNSDYLRELGCNVYAYDPYNYNSKDGWSQKTVSSILPTSSEKFDAVFSSYVLNVMPKSLEKDILAQLKKINCKKYYHIVRNADILSSVGKALDRKDPITYGFFQDVYWKKSWGLIPDKIDKQILIDFCRFGVQTSKGFQRITDLEDSGYKLIYKNTSYKIFSK